MTDTAVLKVYPGIGIGRIGNSPETFIGPEIPNKPPNPQQGFKDKEGRYKRQGIRFRVFMHDGDTIREVKPTDDDVESITWNVELGNKKCSYYEFTGRFTKSKAPRNFDFNPVFDTEARRNLMNLPQPVSITIDGEKSVEKTFEKDDEFWKPKPDVKVEKKVSIDPPILGNVVVTSEGCEVYGGFGDIKSVLDPPAIIPNYANSDYWYDDTSDGPVTAVVKFKDKEPVEAERAWAVFAPIKAAPTMRHVVTLYRELKDVFVEHFGVKEPAEVSYFRDIRPVLQAAVDSAWINPWAAKGHGPLKGGNFLLPEIESHLKHPKAENEDENKRYRERVFFRLRVPQEKYPTTLEDYDSTSYGQANTYFMPMLSGDNGDISQSDPSTFLTLSLASYNKFKDWCDGKFVTGEAPKDYENFSDIPVQERPEALQEASLEWGIGGPFFPGMELTYFVRDKATWKEPWRFADSWKAGDATKYMALPWSADFNECTVHWWPAARADQVLPEGRKEEFIDFLKKKKHHLRNKKQEERVMDQLFGAFENWTRGFTADFPAHGYPHLGDNDMTENWYKLGVMRPFTIEYKVGNALTGHTERSFTGFYEDYRETLHSNNVLESVPVIKVETASLSDLALLLRAAMKVELSTIPPYLFSLFSLPNVDTRINNDMSNNQLLKDYETASDCRSIIHSVVIEEMLHLSLAANVLSAIDESGPVKFYERAMVPIYPTRLPFHDGPLALNLVPASLNQITQFAKIEQPEHLWKNPKDFIAKFVNNFSKFAVEVVDEVEGNEVEDPPFVYKSLAQFYDKILKILKKLDGEGKVNWNGKNPVGLQMGPGQGFYPTAPGRGGLVLVEDLNSANKALKRIIEQGEGAGLKEIVTKNDVALGPSHYERFEKVIHKIISAPKGETWWDSQVIPASGYDTMMIGYGDPQAISLTNRLHNATYCYTLLTLDNLYREVDVKKKLQLVHGALFGAMKNVMKGCADLLMKMPLSKGFAGPTFEFFDFSFNPDGVQRTPKEMLVNLGNQAKEAVAKEFPSLSGDIDTVLMAVKGLYDGVHLVD